ncbi:MAG: cupin domain-containing protein [Ferruginibacter sp.]
MKPITVAPNEGKAISVGNSKLLVKLLSEDTGNAMSITEYELAPQFPGPPAHKHKVFEHAWYVLEGSLTIQLDDQVTVLAKGSFIFIPKKTVHAFSNKTDEWVKLLVIDTPGGFEKYYDDLESAFGNGKIIDQGLMREIQLKYDTYPPEYNF